MVRRVPTLTPARVVHQMRIATTKKYVSVGRILSETDFSVNNERHATRDVRLEPSARMLSAFVQKLDISGMLRRTDVMISTNVLKFRVRT